MSRDPTWLHDHVPCWPRKRFRIFHFYPFYVQVSRKTRLYSIFSGYRIFQDLWPSLEILKVVPERAMHKIRNSAMAIAGTSIAIAENVKKSYRNDRRIKASFQRWPSLKHRWPSLDCVSSSETSMNIAEFWEISGISMNIDVNLWDVNPGNDTVLC